jgi:hypothetical protein
MRKGKLSGGSKLSGTRIRQWAHATWPRAQESPHPEVLVGVWNEVRSGTIMVLRLDCWPYPCLPFVNKQGKVSF